MHDLFFRGFRGLYAQTAATSFNQIKPNAMCVWHRPRDTCRSSVGQREKLNLRRTCKVTVDHCDTVAFVRIDTLQLGATFERAE